MMNPPWRSSLFGRQEQAFSAPGFVQSINAMGHWQAFDCAAALALILQPLNVRSLSDIPVLRDICTSCAALLGCHFNRSISLNPL